MICSFHPAGTSWAGPPPAWLVLHTARPTSAHMHTGVDRCPLLLQADTFQHYTPVQWEQVRKNIFAQCFADRSSTVSNETRTLEIEPETVEENKKSFLDTTGFGEGIVGSQNYQNKGSTWSSNWAFKKDYAGDNLNAGILSLMNLVKDDYSYQPSLNSQISLQFNRNKEQKADSMENERGLFVQSLFKRVLENLIFNDKRESLQRGMSTSNIGGRKNKSSCDHLFVAHEIINSVINWEGEDTDFFIYDNRRHLINYIWKVVQWKLLIHYQCMKIWLNSTTIQTQWRKSRVKCLYSGCLQLCKKLIKQVFLVQLETLVWKKVSRVKCLYNSWYIS